jgi:hypothetical protein
MKRPATTNDLKLLSAIRGTFGPSRGERFKQDAFSCFLVAMSVFLLAVIYSLGHPVYPIDTGRCFVAIVALMNVGLAVFLWRVSGQTYVFDGEMIHQMRRGRWIWKEIEISKIIEITVRQTRNVKSMQLRTERLTMGVLLYQELQNEIKNRSNQALVPTPASVTPAADAPVAPDAGAAHL